MFCILSNITISDIFNSCNPSFYSTTQKKIVSKKKKLFFDDLKFSFREKNSLD